MENDSFWTNYFVKNDQFAHAIAYVDDNNFHLVPKIVPSCWSLCVLGIREDLG